jgi:protein-S-isoprenylcysteine O-methyltransferase Ste14
MHTVDVVVGLGWLVFWGYWLASAFRVKPGLHRWGQFAGSRLIIAVVLVAALRIPALRGHRSHSSPEIAIGLVLFVAGLALAVWARIHLGRNWGTPMTEKHDVELVTTGPYRWIRNPIYSGLILAMIGTTVAVSVTWLVVTVCVGSYFVYSAFMEERFMATRLPDSYPAYRSSTKRLIPFVF